MALHFMHYNFAKIHSTIRLEDPPPELAEFAIDWDRLSLSHVTELTEVLADAADESPLQRFLTEQPQVLILGVIGQMRQEAWVLPKPKFGAEFVPDFLIGARDSLGPQWRLVELESPHMDPLRKDGEIRRCLHHAVEQIMDWRRWLKEHAAYFRAQSGCWGIESACEATIVIGRREMRDRAAGRARIRELRDRHIEVMSYDRLVERYSLQSGHHFEVLRRVEGLAGPN